MGDVISIDGRRDRRPGVPTVARPGTAAPVIDLARRAGAAPVAGGRPVVDAPPRTTFFVDPAAPAAYLVAERVERSVSGMRWRVCPPLEGGSLTWAQRVRTEARAAELRVPLRWPDDGVGEGTALRRMATFASTTRAVQAITLAAGRLAFAGGHDLDDPEILVELAAIAGLDVDEALAAAVDPAYDSGLRSAAAAVRLLGADALPAIQVGTSVFCGESRVPEALAAVRAARFRSR